MTLPWFKFSPRDWLDGAFGLTAEERGVYITLIALIYQRAGPLPDEPRWLAGNCLLSVRAWTKVRASLIVKGKIYVTDDGDLMNARADIELGSRPKTARKVAETSAKLPDKTAENRTTLNENSDLQAVDIREKKRDTERKREPKGSLSICIDPKPSSFDQFWAAYPSKVGKKAARRAWDKARDKPSVAELLAAVDRYRRTKPADREWCNPQTWLNQGRWDDAPEPLATSPPSGFAVTRGPSAMHPDLIAARKALEDAPQARAV